MPQDVPDIIAPDLAVLFCGINPGLLSGELGQHFARPGNRFWKVLHLSGFTDRQLKPSEQRDLLGYRVGITNIVDRTTRAATDVTADELRQGARNLERKASRYRPGWIAVCGVLAYRRAFNRPKAAMGPQPERIGATGLWVLPNPSGLQARYQLPEMVAMFSELRRAAEGPTGRRA